MQDIERQIDDAYFKLLNEMPLYIIPHIIDFGFHIINDIAPKHKEFDNLTGNTLTSYSFGAYYRGRLEAMGQYDGSPALMRKLKLGDVFTGYDYDQRFRNYFIANVDTDGGWGTDSASSFLKSYAPPTEYGLIVTTGTEYSAYLENVRKLDVLHESMEYSREKFLKSFKPIKSK